MKIQIEAMSESALVCTLPPPADLSKQQRLWAFAAEARMLESAFEVVTGMNNVTVFADEQANLVRLENQLQTLWQNTRAHVFQGKHVQIPVVYGGEFGMDLCAVAAYHGISPEQLVCWHTEPVYTVFMVGFQAGFPYLGGLPEKLHTPRHEVPRREVASGSVGIGGSQTGVYPFASPGGWQILGKTDLPLFDATQNPPTLLAAGDTVSFVAERVCL